MDNKEQQLYALMKENGIEGLKIDGKNLFPQSQYWASIPEYIEDDGFSQLEKLGLESLIKRKVNTQTLSAEMRRRIDEGEIVKIDTEGVDEKNVWVWKTGPLKDSTVSMSISEVKKIGIRKA